MQDRIAQWLRGAGPARGVKCFLQVLHGSRRALPLRIGAIQARAGTRTPFRASRVVPVVFPLIGLIIFAGAPSAHAQSGVLTLDPASGHPGDSVTAQGAGFECVGSTAVVQWDDGTTLANPTVQTDGSFSAIFTVPAGAALDNHPVTARCFATEVAATADFTVLAPTLTLDPESGHPGDSISAQGAGFDCPVTRVYGENAAVVQWDGTTLANPTVQTGGSFAAIFAVPRGAALGNHTVTARCAATEAAAATADFAVLSATPVEPTLTLSTASGIPGTRVTANGSGFDCATGGIGRRGPIEVLWDDAGLAAANADDAGGFSVEFTVPARSAEGTHSVTARCADGAAGQTAVATFSVRPVSTAPTLNLTPGSGEARTTIAVNGQRYPRACVTFAMRLDGEVLPLRVRAISPDAATGTVAVTSEFDVPESAPAGTRTASLECTNRDGKLLASATAAFTVAAAGSSLLPGVIALMAALIVAAVLALLRARHVRGQRAWVREHVQVRSRQRAADVSVDEPGTERSHAVRLTAHLDAGTQDAKEVAP